MLAIVISYYFITGFTFGKAGVVDSVRVALVA